MVSGIVMVVVLVSSSAALFVYYRNTAYQTQLSQERKDAFNDWVKRNQTKFQGMAGTIATSLKPVYEDIVTDKSSPEVTAGLVAKYKAYLQPAGCTYGWCKKSWTVKEKPNSTLISPDNAQKFDMQPANAAPLSEPLTLTNINGEITQSGTVTLYYDIDAKKPVAVLNLNLAPPAAAQAAGGPTVKAVPPTSFTLWYDTEPLEGMAREQVELRLKAPPPTPGQS